MKKTFPTLQHICLLMLLQLTLITVNAQVVNYSQLEHREHVTYLKGNKKPFTGTAREYYDNTKTVKIEVQFVQGLKEGLCKTWFKSGKPESQKPYKANKLEGTAISWFESGSVERKVDFANDRKNGMFTTYFANGQIKEQGSYKLGKKEGIHKGWYETGKPESECTFIGDLEDGIHTEWYDNGKKYCEKTYKMGNEISAKYWTKEGRLMTPDEVKTMLASMQTGNLMQMWQQQQGGK